MKKSLRYPAKLALLLLLFAGARALAQAPEQVPEDSEPLSTITKDVEEVSLVFSVTDGSGKFARDLRLADFAIKDKGLPPERVVYFDSHSDLPLHALLLVDVSDSIRPHFDFEKQSAILFLERTLRPRDQAAVIGFNRKLNVLQDFTHDTSALAAGVHALKVKGSTSVYDAVFQACKKFPRAGTPVRRVIIIISDGDDNTSVHSPAQAEAAAMNAGVVVFALSTNTPDNAHKHRRMEKLARATGGRMLRARSEKEITKAYQQLEEELRSQYAVVYKPANLRADGKYRKIQVKALRSGLNIHARSGYYTRTALSSSN
jgi:Ca-activated chloride channel homolog